MRRRRSSLDRLEVVSLFLCPVARTLLQPFARKLSRVLALLYVRIFTIPFCLSPPIDPNTDYVCTDIDNILRTSPEDEGYNMVPPAVLRPLNALREQVQSTEMNEQYKAMQDVAQILAQAISQVQKRKKGCLSDLTKRLFYGRMSYYYYSKACLLASLMHSYHQHSAPVWC